MTVKVKLHPALARAAVERARKEERYTEQQSGVAGLMRHALRYYLSKNGYRVADLDQGLVINGSITPSAYPEPPAMAIGDARRGY